MDMIGWLVAFVILIGIEAATMALTTIWFAGGAVFAFFAAVLEFSVQTQLVVFLIVSGLSFFSLQDRLLSGSSTGRP